MSSDASQQPLATSAAEATTGNDFEALLTKEFRPKSDSSGQAIRAAVKTLAAQVLEGASVISGDALASIEGIIAEIDRKLSEQVNEILHHEEFQALESSWRGLHYLVNNTETDTTLKIRVLNISKNELGKTLDRKSVV